MTTLKFCPFCGFKLEGGEEFCPNCGKKLPEAADVVADSSHVAEEAPASPAPVRVENVIGEQGEKISEPIVETSESVENVSKPVEEPDEPIERASVAVEESEAVPAKENIMRAETSKEVQEDEQAGSGLKGMKSTFDQGGSDNSKSADKNSTPINLVAETKQVSPVKITPKRNKNWLLGVIVGVLLLCVGGGVAFYVTRSPQNKTATAAAKAKKGGQFSGTYSATIPMLYSDAEDSLEFSDGEVTETFDGKTTKGTYKISGDKIIVVLGKSTFTGKFAKDKKSFAIESADVELGLVEGTQYVKGAKKVDSVAVAQTPINNEKPQIITRPVKGTFAVKANKVVIATGRHVVSADLVADSPAGEKSFEVAEADVTSMVEPQKAEAIQVATEESSASSESAAKDSETTKESTKKSETEKTSESTKSSLKSTKTSESTKESTENSATTTSCSGAISTDTGKKVKGTYEVAGDLFTLKIGRYTIIIKISADKKTFELVSMVIAPEKVVMNFDEIEKGNFTSLLGEWKLIAKGSMSRLTGKMDWEENPLNDMFVSKDKIQTNSIGIVGSNFVSGSGSVSPGEFKESEGRLLLYQTTGGLYWSTAFYPEKVGGIIGFLDGSEMTLDNSKNNIVFSGRDGGDEIIYEQVSPN